MIRLVIPSEIILIFLLWIFLSIFTRIYLIRHFGLSNVLACFVLSIVFVGALIAVSALLMLLRLPAGIVAIIISMWTLFLIARSLIDTKEWTTRENVLFASVMTTYLAFYILTMTIDIVSSILG